MLRSLGIKADTELLLAEALNLLSHSDDTNVGFFDYQGNFCAVGAVMYAYFGEYRTLVDGPDIQAAIQALYFAIPREIRNRETKCGNYRNNRRHAVYNYNDQLSRIELLAWVATAVVNAGGYD